MLKKEVFLPLPCYQQPRVLASGKDSLLNMGRIMTRRSAFILSVVMMGMFILITQGMYCHVVSIASQMITLVVNID
jgi:hypothetical protein